MNHPSEATLALFSGGDLGPIARWRTDHHLKGCDQCRREVAGFFSLRSAVTELDELPQVSWPRLAAEMKANIRVGLAAGECVSARTEPRFRPTATAMVGYAVAAMLVIAGLWLQNPGPPASAGHFAGGVVLEATRSGIQLKQDGHVLSLRHGQAKDVMFSAGAQGVMRARYLDSETGYVTINNVYGQ